MSKNQFVFIGFFVSLIAVAGCSGGGNSTTVFPNVAAALPTPSNNIAAPSGVTASSGYSLSVFASPPPGSTKPDSLAQIGNKIFVGFGDTVNPDGTAGPTGATSTEVVQYDLAGNQQKVYKVIGHNDGLLAYDANTLWAMSNEDGNATLVVINVNAGTQQTYVPQPGLQVAGALPHGGGLDDMQLIGGKVYVSASNPSISSTTPCPANSSTPGCPNGVSNNPFVYMLSLNSDGSTFNLTPVANSSVAATNTATGASGTFNITDPDSEVVSPDGSTLYVDGQADSELAVIKNPGPGQTLSFLPLAGGVEQIDDTRFVPTTSTYLLVTDTSGNLIYRIDAPFNPGDAFSAATSPPGVIKLNTTSGAFTQIASGMKAPHGLLFVVHP